jgi:hypothetical protein
MFEDLAPEDVLAAVAATDFAALAPDDLGASRIDAVAALERVVRVAQARIVEQIDGLYRDRLQHVPVGHGDPSLSVAAEVAMARGVSPATGRSQFALMMALQPMRAVRSAFGAGEISEPVARAIAREIQNLDDHTAEAVDAALESDLTQLTPGKATQLTRELVVTHDVEAARQREIAERAIQYVHHYPEPGGIASLVVRGPAEQLLATHQALQSHADRRRAAGDPRDRGQLMAGALFERVTGLTQAEGHDVDLSIVMPLQALQGAPVAAELAGHGSITPGLAAQIADTAGQPWYRRLFTDPAGDLARLDTRRRCFTGTLAQWIRTRDHHRCRQPGCGCRSTEVDHITPHRRGGPTTQTNGQAVCRLSNLIKELPGWRTTRGTNGEVVWTTPTGHTYTSPAPRRTG